MLRRTDYLQTQLSGWGYGSASEDLCASEHLCASETLCVGSENCGMLMAVASLLYVHAPQQPAYVDGPQQPAGLVVFA